MKSLRDSAVDAHLRAVEVKARLGERELRRVLRLKDEAQVLFRGMLTATEATYTVDGLHFNVDIRNGSVDYNTGHPNWIRYSIKSLEDLGNILYNVESQP